MIAFQVQDRVVGEGHKNEGVTRQWYVSLGGYTWYVDQYFNGQKKCSCPAKHDCMHTEATEAKP